jgi:hypothetical protein
VLLYLILTQTASFTGRGSGDIEADPPELERIDVNQNGETVGLF